MFKWEENLELKRIVLNVLRDSGSGLTDNELAAKLLYHKVTKETVKSICRQLDFEGKIDRLKAKGVGIRNFYIEQGAGRWSVKTSDGLEATIISVLKKNEGMSADQIYEKVQPRGLSKQTVSELCKQLDYKGLIRRVPGNPYLHYLK